MPLTEIDDFHFEGGKNLNKGQQEGDDKVLADIMNDTQAQVNTNQTGVASNLAAAALNTTHRSSDGSNHSIVVANAAALAARVIVHKFTYDESVLGGELSTIALTGGTPIPDNAILVYAYLDILTTVVSDASGTLALQMQGAEDVLAVVTDPSTLSGVVMGEPIVGPTLTKASAARGCSIVIGTTVIASGKFDVYLHVVLGSA